jgi:Family of unknown function (DUF6152)
MKRKLVTSFGLAVGLLMICAPVFAHHGGSDYDTQNLLTLKGTVTEFLCENRHCQVFLDVKLRMIRIRPSIGVSKPSPRWY